MSQSNAKRNTPLMPDTAACQRVAEEMVSYALAAGADGAEVLLREGAELEVKVRLGETELVKEAGSRGLGLRVIKDNRVANTHSSDFDPAAMKKLAAETVQLAELAEPDEFAALPERSEMAREFPDLGLWDDKVALFDVQMALDWAQAAEAAARGFDKRITNSDGATFGRVMGASAFVSSAGFSGSSRGTYASGVVRPICDDADGKKRNGYWWTGNRLAHLIENAESIGNEAARRTVAKLGPRKLATQDCPVIFPPETAKQLVGKLAGLASGGAIWRKSSYFAEREGTQVAAPSITLTDDPLIPGASGSRAFDGEGLATRPNVIVDSGILKTFLCDTYSARKLGRTSTGSAGRGIGGGAYATTSNLILRPGTMSPEEIAALDGAFFVTELMGFGFNAVTGDFSQGAGGFWIEKGEKVFPVSEVTISANFDDLWKRVDAVGNDLDTRTSVHTPTLRVSSMTIAGT
jgi:PmbA protein